jgi:hypothetical protein
MWQLWAWSLAVPAALALGVYALLRWLDSPRYSRREITALSLGVFGVFAVGILIHNLLDDGIAPDPYHDAQSPYEAA